MFEDGDVSDPFSLRKVALTSGVRQPEVKLFMLPTSYVTIGKLLDLSEPQLPHL